MTEAIPSFPVIHVETRPDGSAHVNVAGQHIDYPPADDAEATRAAVIAYAVSVAERLGRPVRTTIRGTDGPWELAVAVDGTVVDLAPEPTRATPRRRGAVSTPITAGTAVIESPPAATPVTPPAVVPMPAVPAMPLPLGVPPEARLRFSTGQEPVVLTGEPGVLGRDPGADVLPGARRIVVYDEQMTVSRTHAELTWQGDTLQVTDLGSGNGTRLGRLGAQSPIPVGIAHAVQDGDVIYLGPTVTLTVTLRRA